MSDQAKVMSTILIVDDEPTNLAVLSEILRPNYRVLAANSGLRALALVEGDVRPDLILLDIMMPDLDGYEVIKQLKANPNTADIPVIFVTALHQDVDEENGFIFGAVDYIHKPIKPRTLLARCQTHLELKAAKDRIRRENELLEQEVEKRLKEIELVQDMSLKVVAELVETRDTDTGYHIQRTQSYMRLLTQSLLKLEPDLLTQEQADLFVKSAPLHDIGKIGISDEILLKPGALDEDEIRLMKTHTIIGSDTLDHAITRVSNMKHDLNPEHLAHAFAFIETARDVARYHHERWDGQGYPDGLAGEDIPLSARIMSLADAFDAITSPRVYKKAISVERAKEIILKERGVHFDPKVVDAFEACYEDFVEVAHHYQDSAD